MTYWTCPSNWENNTYEGSGTENERRMKQTQTVGKRNVQLKSCKKDICREAAWSESEKEVEIERPVKTNLQKKSVFFVWHFKSCGAPDF